MLEQIEQLHGVFLRIKERGRARDGAFTHRQAQCRLLNQRTQGTRQSLRVTHRRQKSGLVMAHDLRNPVAAVKMLSRAVLN